MAKEIDISKKYVDMIERVDLEGEKEVFVNTKMKSSGRKKKQKTSTKKLTVYLNEEDFKKLEIRCEKLFGLGISTTAKMLLFTHVLNEDKI